jgi:AraC-like DNA-binding protein
MDPWFPVEFVNASAHTERAARRIRKLPAHCGFNLVREGLMRIAFDGHPPVDVRPGDVLGVLPGIPYRLTARRVRYWFLTFRGAGAVPMMQAAGLGPDRPVIRSPGVRFERLLYDLLKTLPQRRQPTPFWFASRLTGMMEHLCRARGAGLSRGTHSGRVRSWLEEWGYPPAGVEQIAGDLGITPDGLRKACHREVHMPAVAWLRQLRLDRAAHLLRETPDKVGAIAAACGFASEHHFHRAFKKTFGATPARFRRTLQ